MDLLTRLFGYSEEINQALPALGERVVVNGAALHLLCAGQGERPPLILIHGASGNVRDWTTSIFDSLAERYRVIAVDRPGFGHSDAAPGEAWTLDAQVRQMRDALNRLGHDRYVLLGHSYGGAVAMRWALTHPDELAGVLSLSGATMDWGGGLGWQYRLGSAPVIGTLMAQAARLVATPDYLDAAIRDVFAPQDPPAGYVEAGGVRLAVRPHTFRLNAMMTHRLYPQILAQLPGYRTLGCPVYAVHGDADTTVPASIHAHALADAVPDGTVQILSGIGHMPHHAVPDRVIAAIDHLYDRI